MLARELVCVCVSVRAQKIAYAVVFVVFHSLCCALSFCCCCCYYSCCRQTQPKGQRTHTRFFFGVCFCAWRCLTTTTKATAVRASWRAVPLRASERVRDWAPSAVWKFYKKEETNFEVNAHFTFSLPSCLFIFLLSLRKRNWYLMLLRLLFISLIVVVPIALINLHNICKAFQSDRVCERESDNNKNNSHLYMALWMCTCVCVRACVNISVYACLVGPLVNRGRQAMVTAALLYLRRRHDNCDALHLMLFFINN